MVTTRVEIVQRFCFVIGVFCGYRNRSYSANLLCFLEIILVSATVDLVQ